MTAASPRSADLGDLVVVLVAATLAQLRDRLAGDGFESAAELVADMVDIADDYVAHLDGRPQRGIRRRTSRDEELPRR